MAKPLKIVGIILGVIVVLLSAAIIYIALFFDPNAYKPQISKAVQDATGRELHIKGDIELSLFPWIGMALGEVSLSNAPGFGEAPFARIEAAEVKLRLLPLLRQEVEMKAVILRGLRLNLEIAADGTSNWQDLGGSAAETSGQIPTSAPQPSSKDGGMALAALAIGGIEISDARVNYVDHTSDSRYSATQLNLSTGPVALDRPVDVSLNSQFSSTQPPLQGQLALDTRIGFELQAQRYRLDGLVLETTAQGADIPGGKAQLRLAADIAADLEQQTATISNLTLSSYGVDLKGRAEVRDFMTTAAFQGELALQPFNARQLLQQLGQTVPETADPQALTRVAVTLSFSGKPEAVDVQSLQLQLDESTLSGQLGVRLAADKPLPALRYDLHLDTIDADRYLPPPSDETVAVPPPSAGAAAAGTLPMALLRDLDIEGALDIDALKVAKLRLSAIKTPLKAQNGVITLDPEARLYQGSYTGRMELDARQESPRFKLEDRLSGVQAGPLLQDLMDDALVSGTANVSSRLTTAGHTPEQMTQALNGRVELAFTDGQIKGINLGQIGRELKARLAKQPLPARDEVQGTDFTELSATLNIKDGVIHNNDLSTKAPYVRISGAGTVNLVQEQLDYLIKAAIVESAKGAGGAGLEELKGLTVPVKISGSFTQPKVDIQYDELLKARAKQALEAKKQELKDKAAAEKAELQQKLDAEKEAAQLKLEQERLRLEQELKAKQKKELEKKEEELKNKLKGLFN